MLTKVKRALFITVDDLDEEIEENIESCKSDLIRMGIDPSKISAEDPLIVETVKTYCKAIYEADLNKAKRYEESYQYQANNLRKSLEYVAFGG